MFIKQIIYFAFKSLVGNAVYDIRIYIIQVGAKTSVQILRSDEGRRLRHDHKANVSYLREKLFDAGVAAQHTPSHIIPIHVS